MGKNLPLGEGGSPKARRMRVWEHQKPALYKIKVQGLPSSAPFGGTFPQGKVWGSPDFGGL